MNVLLLLFLLAILVLAPPALSDASPTVVNVWPGPAPGETASQTGTSKTEGGVTRMTDVTQPQLLVFRPEGKGPRPAVMVCPGGGYGILATDLEGTEVAHWLNGLGYVAAVLHYRVPGKREGANQDAQRALSLLRSRAGEFGIDPKRLGVLGFSAGGHLAARLAAGYAQRAYPAMDAVDQTSCRPDFALLIYPAYLMDKDSGRPAPGVQPQSNMPPMFLMQTLDDSYLDVPAYAKALGAAGVESRAVTYEKGGHGYGLRLPADQPAHAWANEAAAWLRQHTAPPINAARLPKTCYLFCSFRDNGEDGLHLAWSADGLTWTALNNDHSVLTPEPGVSKLMRDPCILQGPDGTFHLVWTGGWDGHSIGYAHSRDLIHWAAQKSIPVMQHEPTARNCWAPEVVYDRAKKQFVIFWATTIPGRFPQTDASGDDGYNHRIYGTTTKDFETFTPSRLFYDPGFNVIDATMLSDKGRHFLIVKDETKTPVEKNLRIAEGAQSEGPFGVASPPFTRSWVEGPSALQIGRDWLVYFDCYTESHYGAVKSRDLKTWQDITPQVSFPPGTRHGTAIRVDRAVLARLLDVSASTH